MLRFLSIKRLAVIDAVEVEFEPGFNVLTGETGAGKSMLVEAVGLLLGGRASGDLVRTGEDSASIEAIFESAGEELIVRREITAQGRSRAFVNGALATAGALRDLSERLVELHGQHEHQTLLDPSTHVAALDAFGALDRLLIPTREAHEKLRASGEELTRVRRVMSERDARLELASFQLGELDRASLRAGEDDELAAARQVLASADRVTRLCAESYAALYESDDAILVALAGVWRRVGELASLDPQFQPYLATRDDTKAQLEDLASFLRRYADGIEASPARLQQVEDRLALLERLKRKYGPTLGDVIQRRDSLRREVDELQQADSRMAMLEKEHDAARRAYLAAAESLSGERRHVAADFERRLEQMLGELAMERTRFEVRFGPALDEPDWSAQGTDQVEFFVSPNPGEALRPLARIVSGGELSRIMLTIKTLTAASRRGFSDATERPPGVEAPGLIFDEVDAGIGGRVADVVGKKLRSLGSAFQVLCITHLPQIAAHADVHYQIDKRVDEGRTKTTVERLSDSGRVEELARMLGGRVSDRVRATAREMMIERRGVGSARLGQADGRAGAKGESTSKGESERSTRRVSRNGRMERPER